MGHEKLLRKVSVGCAATPPILRVYGSSARLAGLSIRGMDNCFDIDERGFAVVNALELQKPVDGVGS